MTIQDLEGLADSARSHNERVGVSGMLLYMHGSFLQHIEGRDSEVTAVFERIRSDMRHTGLRVLSRRPRSERRFPHWSMGFDAPETEALRAWLTSGSVSLHDGPVPPDPTQLLQPQVSEALLGIYAP